MSFKRFLSAVIIGAILGLGIYFITSMKKCEVGKKYETKINANQEILTENGCREILERFLDKCFIDAKDALYTGDTQKLISLYGRSFVEPFVRELREFDDDPSYKERILKDLENNYYNTKELIKKAIIKPGEDCFKIVYIVYEEDDTKESLFVRLKKEEKEWRILSICDYSSRGETIYLKNYLEK